VILFSCGGRADGSGTVTNFQLFSFNGSAGLVSLTPLNVPGICMTIANGQELDQTACNTADAAQSFTFGAASATASGT